MLGGGWLFIVFSRRKQALHDVVTECVVLNRSHQQELQPAELRQVLP
jgi:hypothetical protein